MDGISATVAGWRGQGSQVTFACTPGSGGLPDCCVAKALTRRFASLVRVLDVGVQDVGDDEWLTL